MSQQTFWSRLTSRFKQDSQPATPIADQDQVGAQNAITDLPEENSDTGTTLLGRRKKEDVLVRVEEGFQRMTQLCDSLQDHFDSQEKRAEDMAMSIKSAAGGVNRLAEVVEAQGNVLNAIAKQIEAGVERASRIEDLTLQFSKLTEAQRQSLANVAKEIETARQTDSRITESLTSFQETLGRLNNSQTSISDTVERIQQNSGQREDKLDDLIHTQNKRFMMLFVVTLVMALAGIVSSIIAMMSK